MLAKVSFIKFLCYFALQGILKFKTLFLSSFFAAGIQVIVRITSFSNPTGHPLFPDQAQMRWGHL